MKTNTCLKSL